jgi:hypothetical protein
MATRLLCAPGATAVQRSTITSPLALCRLLQHLQVALTTLVFLHIDQQNNDLPGSNLNPTGASPNVLHIISLIFEAIKLGFSRTNDRVGVYL